MLRSNDSSICKLRIVNELPIVSLQFLNIRLIGRGDVAGSIFSIDTH